MLEGMYAVNSGSSRKRMEGWLRDIRAMVMIVCLEKREREGKGERIVSAHAHIRVATRD